MTTQTTTSARTARDAIQQSVGERPSTDYIVHFWTALGWRPRRTLGEGLAETIDWYARSLRSG